MCEDQDCIFFNGIPTGKNMKVRGLLWFLQGCRDQDGPHKTTKDKYLYLDKSIKKIEILYCEPKQGTILGEESEGEDDGEDEEEKRPFESLMV